MVETRNIVVRRAGEHNLKDIDVSIPRDSLIVFTGLSGSGKSSLAFDTIYAEGQRRYLESLSAYARQFLEQMNKPKVESVEGLSPSISIEQKNISKHPRSTVGTVTEAYDFLRLLYARIGTPHDPETGRPLKSQSIDEITDQIMEFPTATRFAVMSPIVRGRKGEYQKELKELRNQGFVKVKIDGKQIDLTDPIKLNKNNQHDISAYIDRLVMKDKVRPRLSEAIELAGELSDGTIEIERPDQQESVFYSTKFATTSGLDFSNIEPINFSFNSPRGACTQCDGLGIEEVFDEKLIVDGARTLNENALLPWADMQDAWKKRVFTALKKKFRINPDKPFGKLAEKHKEIILQGSGTTKVTYEIKSGSTTKAVSQIFEGILPMLDRQWEEAEEIEDEETLIKLSEYISERVCTACLGARLNETARQVLINGTSISDVSRMTVPDCLDFLDGLRLRKAQRMIAEPILKEISARLKFLENVGLAYLTLSRSAATLSGGEAQRIRLATQIGSSLVGVLYVLDEPSIGLHQRDNHRLIGTLKALRDNGNTVIVVEHDEDTIKASDYLVDIGPGAGIRGGHIVYSGDPHNIESAPGSLTGAYLSGAKKIDVPKERRIAHPDKKIRVVGARENNLKNITVEFPLGLFICLTGVSGSGKSSLVIDTLLKGLKQNLNSGRMTVNCDSIEGLESIDKVIHVDQSPIGRTPRSNPATYTGVFSDIRSMFAGLPESKMRGYGPGRFSFNVPGGRCEACKGDGTIKIEMNFLPDVFVKCEVCQSKRYNRETLQVRYRGKSIAEVLSMGVNEAVPYFERIPQIASKLRTLDEVGLGYLSLGQSAITLSGGEAQRIKLAKELNKRSTGKTVYVLDEPTTGLHFDDVNKLMIILHRLVDEGNTVIVIEHHLDVIKQADHVIDIGPEGGEDGGTVLFAGTPEDLTKEPKSYTGKFLKEIL